jgi:glycine/D-amino acid oxidase-like deaminating enzyme
VNHQVIVSDSGISGLSTAGKLAQLGCPVTVIEADDAVGRLTIDDLLKAAALPPTPAAPSS